MPLSQVIYIEITTVTVEKSLVLDKSVLDFGDIAVGFCKVKGYDFILFLVNFLTILEHGISCYQRWKRYR
jgi:hypothetical protein